LLATRLDTAFLFPLAFGVLVLSRASLIARGAILPAAVPSGRSFVSANSSLAKVSALAGMVVLPWGLALVHTLGPGSALRLATVTYLVGALPGVRLPGGRGAREARQWRMARSGSRPVTVRRSIVATSGMRFLVGFLAFHLAFSLRRQSVGAVGLGLLIGAAALGSLLGGVLSGRLRESVKEERIIVSSLAVASGAGMGVGLWFSIPMAAALTFAFGVASGASKVAFDSLVQRQTPEAARGWVFARFEVGLQLSWVAGALIPVAVAIPVATGITAAGAAAGILAAVYAAGRLRRGPIPLP
jgi:hypothetical protein